MFYDSSVNFKQFPHKIWLIDLHFWHLFLSFLKILALFWLFSGFFLKILALFWLFSGFFLKILALFRPRKFIINF